MTTAEYLKLALSRQYAPLPDLIEWVKVEARSMGFNSAETRERFLARRLREVHELKGRHL